MLPERVDTARRRYVRLPLWVWTAIWGMQLLGAGDWGDALAAAWFIAAGFLLAHFDGDAP